MNFIVLAAAFLLTYRLIRVRRFTDALITFFILYLSQIVATELFLGILGRLYPGRLVLLNLFLLVLIWFFALNKTSSFNFGGIKGILSAVTENKIALFGIALISVFAAVKLGINLFNPPFGWDSLNYHFTFPVEWLKHGNLDTPITVFDDPAPTYYPINGSLYFLWLILPFKSVFLADLAQAPFFALAFLSVYALGRKLDLNRRFSFYAAVLFCLIPNFFKQLQVAYVDVMVAALFLAALNYIFILREDFSAKNTFCFGASLGLLIGTKTLALPYAALLFAAFLYLALKNIRKGYLFFAAASAIIALGGFSYVRNIIETGNPLYPLELRIGQWQVFKGVIDSITYRAHFQPGDYRLAKLLFHEGLGLQSLIFILPAALAALPIVWIKKRGRVGLNKAYFLLLPLLIYLIYRYVIPLANARYLYTLLGVGSVSAFYTISLLNIPRRAVEMIVFICMFASMAELAKRQELVASIIITFLVFFGVWIAARSIRRTKFRRRSLICLTALICLPLLAISEKFYEKNEYARYIKMVKYSGFWPDAARSWAWLNENTSGNNIAYVGRPVPFPLYGRHFKNNVYYVSVNRTEPAKLHYFSGSRYRWGYDFSQLHRNLQDDGNYRAQADYAVWLDNLVKRNTDYLFVYSLHQTRDVEFPLEDVWAMAHPERFTRAFEDGTIHIYKIKAGSR